MSSPILSLVIDINVNKFINEFQLPIDGINVNKFQLPLDGTNINQLTVDWGDNSLTQNIINGTNLYTYVDSGEYTINIYGDSSLITHFGFTNGIHPK